MTGKLKYGTVFLSRNYLLSLIFTHFFFFFAVTPIFRALTKNVKTVDFAKQVYAQVRPSYHPASQSRVDGVFEDSALAAAAPTS